MTAFPDAGRSMLIHPRHVEEIKCQQTKRKRTLGTRPVMDALCWKDTKVFAYNIYVYIFIYIYIHTKFTLL